MDVIAGSAMRGLTLTQPWATLVAIGAKRIETRSWSTPYRGLVAIHAAKGLGPVGGKIGLQALCSDEPFRSAIEPEIYEERMDGQGNYFPVWDLMRLPLGAVVAVATLAYCVPTVSVVNGSHPGFGKPGSSWPLTDQERAFGDYAPGRYAWLLSDVRRLATPIPWRGALSLWAVPDLLQLGIEDQL